MFPESVRAVGREGGSTQLLVPKRDRQIRRGTWPYVLCCTLPFPSPNGDPLVWYLDVYDLLDSQNAN